MTHIIPRYSAEELERMAAELHDRARLIAEQASECMAAERIEIHDGPYSEVSGND